MRKLPIPIYFMVGIIFILTSVFFTLGINLLKHEISLINIAFLTVGILLAILNGTIIADQSLPSSSETYNHSVCSICGGTSCNHLMATRRTTAPYYMGIDYADRVGSRSSRSISNVERMQQELQMRQSRMQQEEEIMRLTREIQLQQMANQPPQTITLQSPFNRQSENTNNRIYGHFSSLTFDNDNKVIKQETKKAEEVPIIPPKILNAISSLKLED